MEGKIKLLLLRDDAIWGFILERAHMNGWIINSRLSCDGDMSRKPGDDP